MIEKSSPTHVPKRGLGQVQRPQSLALVATSSGRDRAESQQLAITDNGKTAAGLPAKGQGR
jgi:hypothetical protein